MTAQEIFDRVKNHLLTQNEKAIDSHTEKCLYRTSDNLKCAVGCLIKDEAYDPDMEGEPIGSLFASWPSSFIDSDILRYRSLLNDLQSIHDCYMVDEWPSELLRTANKYGLEYIG